MFVDKSPMEISYGLRPYFIFSGCVFVYLFRYWGLNPGVLYHWATFQALFLFILRQGLNELIRASPSC